jgi:hypothetical protein
MGGARPGQKGFGPHVSAGGVPGWELVAELSSFRVGGSVILKSMLQRRFRLPNPWEKMRRSQRLVLSVPVIAYRSQKLGPSFSEGTRTLVVNAHGALISLTSQVAVDQRLVLKHALSGEEQECRIVFTEAKLSVPTEVGIEFQQPAPNFWCVAFPPADWILPR